MPERQWHIVGTGAIGAFCAVNLERSQQSYSLITRNNQNSIEFQEGELVFRLKHPIRMKDVAKITNILVPTKAYDVLPAIEQFASKLTDGANVVLCHNGMGTLEDAEKLLPTNVNLYFCTTSNGAFKSNGKVTLAGLGDTYWQAIRKSSTRTSLTNKDFECLFRKSQMTTDLQGLLWRKLIINCSINPLTALLNVKNGELAKDKYQHFISELVSETLSIANAEGVRLPAKEIQELVASVIISTSQNTSSMLQDALAKRQTEVNFINGYVVTRAKAHHKPAPLNTLLRDCVDELDTPGLSQQTFNGLFQR